MQDTLIIIENIYFCCTVKLSGINIDILPSFFILWWSPPSTKSQNTFCNLEKIYITSNLLAIRAS